MSLATTTQDWELALKKELKADKVDRFLETQLPEGFASSLLAQSSTAWRDPFFKRAALSWTWTREEDIRWEQVAGLVQEGVWDFILDPFLLGWDESRLSKELQQAAPIIKDLPMRLWVCHPLVHLPPHAFRVLTGQTVLIHGGHAAHELGLVLSQLIDWVRRSEQATIAVAITMEGEFFKSIAKMRALKLSAQAALRMMECEEAFERITWMARSAWQSYTAFDRANNILRATTSLAAGQISGAGVVESLPYDLLVETESGEHERAQRLALTSQLVLQQESSLGEVSDAASGSHGLEQLTRSLAQAGWAVMQRWQKADSQAAVVSEMDAHWQQRQKLFRTRRLVQAGVNDFSDPQEKVRPQKRWQRNDHVRLARDFEELRLSMGEVLPQVALAVVGDYALLQARLNFTKNYFELLGLPVIEPGEGLTLAAGTAWLKQQAAPINVWVASDADHPQLVAQGERCYVAGKTQVEGCDNLYAGQDVFVVLKALAQWWRTCS